jgi:hypothetical protein
MSLLDGTLLQQLGEGFRAFRLLADDDARGMQVVVEGPALAQEFGREDQVLAVELRLQLGGVAHRHGGLEDHGRPGVEGQDIADHRLDGPGVEVVGLGVVVGGGGDDHILGPGVGLGLVEGGPEIQGLVAQVVLDFAVDDGRNLAIEHLHLLGDDVEGHHFIVLGQQDGVGETDVAGAGDGNLHGRDRFLQVDRAPISAEICFSVATGSADWVMGRPMTR